VRGVSVVAIETGGGEENLIVVLLALENPACYAFVVVIDRPFVCAIVH
jgi:hypothetical protein